MPKLFTIGPVNIESDILKYGAEQPLYFRDEYFTTIIQTVLRNILEITGAPEGSKAAMLTASGTAGMEAAVINLFDNNSKVLIVDGGAFGRRFVEICQAYRIPHHVVRLPPGKSLRNDHLAPFRNDGFDGLLINAHETSTGQLYDMRMVGGFCRTEGIVLVCDAISSILADPFNMREMKVDVAIISVNKGLAVTPGLAFVVMGRQALTRLRRPRGVYLDLTPYFEQAERGHTPFTSAVSTIVMLERRLQKIRHEGGAAAIIRRVGELATDFRVKASAAGFRQFPERPSNALTAIRVPTGFARKLYTRIRDRYGWYINPPSFGFEEEIIKIGHVGALDKSDNSRLVAAMAEEMKILSE